MTSLTKLSPDRVARKFEDGEVVLIDIREADEYAREHIPGAISLPVSALDGSDLNLDPGQKAVFYCRSGRRTDLNCDQLARHVTGNAVLMDGGLDNWRSMGLPTRKDTKAPLELNRQVQITAGSLILLGVVGGWLIAPAWFGLSAFVGAGLVFAGVSGWCGMANLLAVMPWNRRQAA